MRLGSLAPRLPDQSELGRIRTADGRVYQITPEDVLWLARSIKYEGGNHAATAWTYAWRLMVKRWSRGLAALVRAHSQPVNPAWDEASDPLCQAHPERCTEQALARRAEAASRTWESLGSIAVLVLDWAQAKVPNPAPRAVDFADPQVSQSYLNRNPTAQVVLRTRNWYIADRQALALPDDFVTIEYEGRTAGARTNGFVMGAGVGLTISALAAGAAYWFFR